MLVDTTESAAVSTELLTVGAVLNADLTCGAHNILYLAGESDLLMTLPLNLEVLLVGYRHELLQKTT